MRLINAQTSGSDSLDAVISIGVILMCWPAWSRP